MPSATTELLASMATFQASVRRAKQDDVQDGPAVVRRQHDELMARARQQLPLDVSVSERMAEAAFFKGGVRAARYRDTVVGDPPLVDTVGSHTLHRFQVDVDERAIGAVHEAFATDRDATAQEDAGLERELSQLSVRGQVMAALDGLFPLVAHATTDDTVYALFSSFYPENPLISGEVKVVRTSTALYFCIPFDDEGLQTRADLKANLFIQTLTDFHPSHSAHFPSFGSLTAAAIPDALVAALAQGTGQTEARLRAILPTMVVVLPAEKVDQYIVHDAWGHGWQALLFEFEESYQRVAAYTDLPGLDASFERAEGAVTLWSCLSSQVAAVSAGEAISDAAFVPWLRAATAERLYDALSGLHAEVLADVVEYKYVAMHPDARVWMPSSSFVAHLPTKFDLTLGDLPYYYERGIGAFERFVLDKGKQGRLLDELTDRGLPRDASQIVVAALASSMGRWLAEVHGRDILCDATDDGVVVNTFTRVALTYLSLHRSLNDLYARLLAQRGDVAFADLLVFSCAAFLEADWGKNFWHLEGFLRHFESLFVRYEAALKLLEGQS
jgi:hypothetical protein